MKTPEAAVGLSSPVPAPELVASLNSGRREVFGPDLAIKLTVPLLLGAALVMAYQWGSLSAWGQLLGRQAYSSWLPGLASGYTVLMLAFQVWRTVLWAGYRPCPLSQAPLPFLSVIIPAYNEEELVEKAIDSVTAADYPAGKLEIICIDDGSRDNTWRHIQRAQQRYPHLVKVCRFTENRGKKAALYAGFIRGRGEVLVTIDSDSIIEPQALRHLVAPLQRDKTIGAVAGNVKVWNRHQSLMGKMQGVRFVNLDYLRAAQSRYGTVICTPGSLSAYRREAIRPILRDWLKQTFLGAPCPHSEDRALTNLILRRGYYTCYQRTAVVYTLVPESYVGVCKMYLRWERGNVRESAVQLGYLFTRYRAKNRFLPMVEFFLAQLEYPMTLFFFGLMLATAAFYPPLLFKGLALLAIGSLLNLIYYLWLERDLEFVYGVIYSFYAFFLLQWIYPYAFITVRDHHWLTR